MKSARFEEIAAIVERFDRITDDAQFLATLKEHGVTASDLKAYAREKDKRARTLRLARRR